MIAYLLYSSISLALLLAVYRFLLEKEKRFTFNRAFLLWSLVFSFIIPLIPVGMASLEIPWSALFSSGETVSVTNYQNTEVLMLDPEVQPTAIENNSALFSSDTLFAITFLLYVSIAGLLFIKLIRIINRIQLKIRRNPKRIIQGYEVVFLNENIVPHTFINTIFLNKKQFEKGEIPREVLSHEFTHVKQKHSLDILFVELLKTIFWFNPLLYLYKNAIALNHEYLADEAVLSKGTFVKDYQRMLLRSMEGNTIHRLASSFNFSLTKRRLQMMTQSKTKVKFLIKLAMLAPFFAGLSLMLGCEPVSNDSSPEVDSDYEMSIEILEDNSLLVNDKNMTLDELESLLSELPESPKLVRMKVSPNAEFGMVTDVQSILKKYEAFKISYSSKHSDDSTELTLPPPPPVPQTSAEARHQMRILMNSQGVFIMNEEPAKLNEVRKNIKAFLSTESEDPSKAIITIKTLPDTPYDRYLELLNEVRGAYDELRNEAGQDQFGMNFSNLEENSSEREAIREMYPMKLSVVPPNTLSGEKQPKIDEATNIYQKRYQTYMDLDPKTTSLKDLRTAFENVDEAIHQLNQVMQEIYGENVILPPVKLGPDPEYRKLINSSEVLELKSKMDQALQSLGQEWKAYLNIEPIQPNSEKLVTAYNKAMEVQKSFGDAQNAYYNSISNQTPPLPPIPLDPQARIENNRTSP
ncbi:MAG: M56 family metallopeptidase [Gracilimonas sp.]|uniref:M56 family metallopeptidase n=1 Tax=Gracilimonas sp. TaxID=1974203 RepID=UPI00374FFBF4|nr:M56 family metallopeptidase [Gracilimonas sp.]